MYKNTNFFIHQFSFVFFVFCDYSVIEKEKNFIVRLNGKERQRDKRRDDFYRQG